MLRFGKDDQVATISALDIINAIETKLGRLDPDDEDQFASFVDALQHPHGEEEIVVAVAKIYGDRPLPDAPTNSPPGPEKVDTLAKRFQRKQHLWHPRDIVDLAKLARAASRFRNGSVNPGDYQREGG